MQAPSSTLRVAAVVVTFDRPKLLKRCIEALLNQTYPIQEIIVIDNAGSDDVCKSIEALGDNIKYLKLAHNVGGAGGFYLGLREAFNGEVDAVVLMDDDGHSDANAVGMLAFHTSVHGTDIVNCLVLDEESPQELAFEMPYADDIIYDLSAAQRHSIDGVLDDRVGAFNGTMISRKAFEMVGNVKAECFIWGDETEYVLRARRKGLRMTTVVGAHHFHPRARGELIQLKPFSSVRIPPMQRSHYFYRNLGFIRFRYMSFPAFLKGGVSYFVTLTAKVGLWEAFKFCLYYIDGASDTYALSPSRRELMEKLPNQGSTK